MAPGEIVPAMTPRGHIRHSDSTRSRQHLALTNSSVSAIEDDDDSKLAAVHKRDIPWEEPVEDN